MSTEGATPSEQILEAARRNNTELLDELLLKMEGAETIAALINNSLDIVGNTALHLAARAGNFEVLDTLLDQEGVEVDPLNRVDRESPLHLAVKYSHDEPDHGTYIVETLIDAGADPQLKNNRGLQPIDLVRSDNEPLRDILENAQYAVGVASASAEPESVEAAEGPCTSDDEE